MQIRRELQTIRKGNRTIYEYCLHVKTLADSLAASGHPISDSDLQQMILNGLDSNYDAIVTTLTTRVDDINMDDFQAHLSAFDMRMQAQQGILASEPIANIAAHSGSNKKHAHKTPNQSHNKFNQHRSQSRNQTQNRDPNRFSSNPSGSSNGDGGAARGE
ncbi:Lipase [Thalictrum thalictroides]|uniref:Lipase n=1 Tax=Thalictrum thalictroides TaxID=46969 RepID=A0A7J6VNY3_THATH|nr:Lipase [Thalictrum thalictroides]